MGKSECFPVLRLTATGDIISHDGGYLGRGVASVACMIRAQCRQNGVTEIRVVPGPEDSPGYAPLPQWEFTELRKALEQLLSGTNIHLLPPD